MHYTTYVFVRLLLLVVVLAQVILVVLVILEVARLDVVIVNFLVGESLSSKPVNGTGDQLLLNILPELIVEFQTFLNVRNCVVVIAIIVSGRFRW